ncbi:recombination-associated protein RdgC [Xanthomonas codiaei]|uniref:Recombination-associated protein RdgC n=1 Tax=Xanthomonas codiaei TaxID=56463 RepID=A0A2S7CGY7_9XANT|nr:recombination-associated protein RdgC [Xanthomonas codiaei]PPU60815.1 recombination-associated protein RdgC [Xanthomonas codiaei]
MFFRNLTFYRFPWAVDSDLYRAFAADPRIDMGAGPADYSLSARLDEKRLKPVGPLELSSRGFVPPYGRDGDQAETFAVIHGEFAWVSVGGQDKLLPGSVVNNAVEAKVAEIEQREGQRPGGRARKRIKDDVVHELLPKAFVREQRTDAFLDMQHGFIAVDSSSRKTADAVCSELRGALGSFPALPLNAEVAPRAVLTAWLAGGPLPAGLSLGEDCELRDPIEGGARVRCNHQELRSDEVSKHLEAGKQVTRLELVLDDHVAFVLGDDLVIRRLRFLDGAIDKLDYDDANGVRAELDARFNLMACEVRRLFLLLEQALHFSKAGG